MNLETINTQTTWEAASSSINNNNARINEAVVRLENSTYKNKGYFKTLEELNASYPSTGVGSLAYVGTTYPFRIYLWNKNSAKWEDSGKTGGDPDVNLNNYYTKSETDNKVSEASKAIDSRIAQETGDSETLVMSQKAVSARLNEAMSEVESLKADIKGELKQSFEQSSGGWNYYPISIVLKKDDTYIFSIELSSAINSSFYWHVIDEVEGYVFETKVINIGGVSGSYELVMQKNFQSPKLAVYSGVSIPAIDFTIQTGSIDKDIEKISETLEGMNKIVDGLEQKIDNLVVQEAGDNEDVVMSQKAVGREIERLGTNIHINIEGEYLMNIPSSNNGWHYYNIPLDFVNGRDYTFKVRLSEAIDASFYWGVKDRDSINIFPNIPIPTGELESYYEFSAQNDYDYPILAVYSGSSIPSMDFHIQTKGMVKDVEYCKKKIDDIYEGEILSVKEYNVDDLKGVGANINYYLHANTLNRESKADRIITKPIFLHVGDEVECSSGGDGFCLFARTPSGVINSYKTDCISISGNSISFKGEVEEDGWYVFSGRINMNDGTNLVVKVKAYNRGKNIFEQLDDKVDRSELGNLVVDSGNSVESIGYAVSVGADSVKDKVPNSPWFDAVDNDGTTYGTYLDDKIDSVPQGNSFIFISDVHYKWNRKQSAKLIDYVRRRLGIKTIIHGGDVINEAPTMSQAAKEWLDFNRDFVFRIGGDFKQVCGDHDHNGKYAAEGQAFSYQFIQRAMNGYNIKELHYDEIYDSQIEEISDANGWSENDKKEYDAWKKMHYYFDDNTIQTRFIVLHTGWTGDVGLAVDKLGSNALSEVNALYLQIEFLYESLLSCPAGYNVVVVGHNVISNRKYSIDTGGGNITRYNVNEPVWLGSWVNVDRMIRAFKKKSSVSLGYKNWSGSSLQTKTFDFGKANSTGVAFCMGGDVHWDILAKTNESEELKPINTATIDNAIVTEGVISKGEVLHALTITDGTNRDYRVIIAPPTENYDDSVDSALASEPATEGTLDSQAFDIVTIAKDAIYFTRIGSGKDRIVHISE